MPNRITQGAGIAVLGSTGSVGAQSLDVCAANGWPVAALAAGSNAALLEQQARRFRPEVAVLADETAAKALRTALADTPVRVDGGPQAVCELAASDRTGPVVGAVVGVAGLAPTLAAARAGKTIALANKEPLVAAGHLLIQTARDCGAQIIPVDSEHSAIFQCLRAGEREDLGKILLTASGGPFFGKTRDELRAVAPADALRHPNWEMGAKITVDSATMMNKGLELIEAIWLFGVEVDQIEILVHRQSVVHSAVEFADGSVIAQMGVPDMRTAIQYALTWPRRLPVRGAERLSLSEVGTLRFELPDRETFRCLAACERAARLGGLRPAAANGANEAAVAAFLDGRIGFLQIGELVCEAVEALPLPPHGEGAGLDAVLAADRLAREFVERTIRS